MSKLNEQPTTGSSEQDQRFLSVREVAQLIGRSESATYTACARGTIPSVRICGSRRIPAVWLTELKRQALDNNVIREKIEA